MSIVKVKDAMLRVRLSSDLDETFRANASKLGKEAPDLVREMVTAFNEGRLRIVPTDDQKKQLGDLYDVN